jgi:23S rRNA (guanosine2251-2'-O)-methyltransferase
MQKETVYIYGKHAIEEAQAHAPHVLKKVMTGVKGEGHGGYVAVVDVDKLLVPYTTFAETLVPTPHTAVLVLGGLTDPHNVGAIIRSAAAFNIAAVLIPTTNQAPITGAVAKPAAGLIFRIPLVSIDSLEEVVHDLKKRDFKTYGLAGDGEAVLGVENFDSPVAFVVGNEGAGLSPEVREACDHILAIPMNPRTESLNAAQAATVVMYEWHRTHSKK